MRLRESCSVFTKPASRSRPPRRIYCLCLVYQRRWRLIIKKDELHKHLIVCIRIMHSDNCTELVLILFQSVYTSTYGEFVFAEKVKNQ